LVNIAQMQAAVPYFLDQIRVHLSWVERQLDEGRAFLLGERVGVVDFTAYQHIWWLRNTYSKSEEFLAPFRSVLAWMTRVAAIGYGKQTDISARMALDVAISSHPRTAPADDPGDPSGRRIGQQVQITPDDYLKVPVVGELIALDVDHVAIRRVDSVAGEIVAHFPRAGFIVSRA
jgi:hypothetical protein